LFRNGIPLYMAILIIIALLAAPGAARMAADTGGAAGRDVAQGDNAPTLKAPRKIYALAGQPASFNVYASDPDGGAVVISLVSAPLPGSTFTDLGGGVATYQITPGAELAGTTATLVFQSSDGAGATATASTELCVGFAPGENPPRLTVPGQVDGSDGKRVASPPIFARAGEVTEVFIEALDPDGGPVTVELAASNGLDATLEATASPEHFKLSISARRSQRGQMIPLSIIATDARGLATSKSAVVDVPPAQGVDVENLAVWWDPPPAGDPFEPPVNIEVFETGGATTRPSTIDDSNLLGYAIYASTTPNFEPGDENLVELALPTALKGNVTLVRPATGGDPAPWYFKVTSRRVEGESRGSEEASSDVPRVPTAVFTKGKLVIAAKGSNILPGAFVEVRQTADEPGERFTLKRNASGTKWVVKKNAVSTPGGLRLANMLSQGEPVFLVIVNPNELASQPFAFTP
jgi:hypothetical protein